MRLRATSQCVVGSRKRPASTEPPVTLGAISALRVRDTTAIDPSAGVGPDGSGWVAEVTLKGIVSTAGTLDATKLVLTVTDPGYTTSGTTTTVTRQIRGVAHVRRQAPNGNSRMISTDGSDLTLLIALQDWVYSGTTITSAAIESGFYTGSVESSAPVITNASAFAYRKPIAGWINPQHERSTANAHAVELVAFHREARAGQQVACVKLQATDGTNTGTESLVSVPVLSTRVTQGFKPEVWAADVDMSTLTNGAVCHVNAKVYPWIGDASAVLDLAADGYAWPTSLPSTRLRVVCDRTGAYGGAYAYVQNGAVGGTVSATAATAKASPFPTVAAAQTAMASWNNTNKGHNNLDGGTIRLMDNAGADYTHQFTSFASNAVRCYVTIEKDPESTAVVGLQCANPSSFSSGPALVKYRNLKLERPTTVLYNFITTNTTADAVRTILCVEGCTFGDFSSKRFVYYYHHKHYLNCTFASATDILLNGENNISGGNIASLIGCTGPGLFTNCNPKMMVGNSLASLYSGVDTNSFGDGDHGKILFNNKVFGLSHNKTTANTLNVGYANVQNVCEVISGGHPMPMFQDGDLTAVSNYVGHHCTAVGERWSRFYNDTGVHTPKFGVDRFSVWDNSNFKDDRFSAGGTGTWAYGYGVGNFGNVGLFGDVGRTSGAMPHNDNAQSPWAGNAVHPTTKFNLTNAAYGGRTQAQVMDLFENYTAAPRAVPALGGDYRPKAASASVFQTVPAGLAVLRYDLLGNLRRNDGTGCAGAYEI